MMRYLRPTTLNNKAERLFAAGAGGLSCSHGNGPLGDGLGKRAVGTGDRQLFRHVNSW